MPSISYSYGSSWKETDHNTIDLTIDVSSYVDISVYKREIIVSNDASEVISTPITSVKLALNIDLSDLDCEGSIYTGIGNDIIRVGNGGMYVNAGSGNDLVVSGHGYDDLDGGDGVDTLSYENSLYGVFVSLADEVAFDETDVVDFVLNFENLIGSKFDDVLSGSDDANVITGGGGFDLIFGEGGADRIVLSETSAVDGGEGYDTVTLQDAGHVYDLGGYLIDVERVFVGDGVEASFENPDCGCGEAGPGLFISLSAAGGGVDLTTTDEADVIRLGDGADTIHAGDGDDTIFAYDGGDGATINGGAGADILIVQSGEHAFTDETLSGVETILVRAGASLDLSAMSGAVAVLVSGSRDGDAGATIVGTAGADRIALGKAGDDVTGGGGDDRLIGGLGDDTFRYTQTGFGRDTVYADLASDHVDLSGVASGLDDLTFKLNNSHTGVIVQIDGLTADSILLKGVTVAQVQAAADDGFFTFA